MAKTMTPRPRFFATPAELRAWFEKHHAREIELWVGYYKKASGQVSITWQESVDQALCFGWIDGVRKSLDAISYANRFTPRTARSTWSAINIRRAGELIEAGLMTPAGLAAFERRSSDRSGTYSYEQRHRPTLDADLEKRFRANRRAWAYFQSEAPWYRRVTTHWVMSARKPETRLRRLETLITDSAAGHRIRGVMPGGRKDKS